METQEFQKEKLKLKSVIKDLEKEEEILVENLNRSSMEFSKDDYVRAHLIYLGEKKIKDIKQIKNKPYFARVDFTEKNTNKLENLYIGKISVLDSSLQEPIIIDWRAPISNLYYDGRIGKSSYDSPDGIIEGNISLFRIQENFFWKSKSIF